MEDYATKVKFTIFYIIRNGINELENWGDELLKKGYPEHSEEFWTLPSTGTSHQGFQRCYGG